MIENKYKNITLKFFIFFVLISFFLINFNKLKFGLPFFLDVDENAFMKSTLSYLSYVTNIKSDLIDPIYAPLFNLLLILKFVFFNELIINSLDFSQIKSKIYFNPELFIYYGRVASLLITTISIYFLFLILRKLKINFYLISLSLVIFSTSLVTFSISTVNGKNSFYLLFFLIQIYFFLKYFLKPERFSIKSYYIFGILGSIGWGINYWPAFVSIYAVIILHFRSFKYRKISNLIPFLLIFIFFGPLINYIFSSDQMFSHVFDFDNVGKFNFNFFFQNFINELQVSFKIIYNVEKSSVLLIILTPFFLFLKKNNKKNIFILLLILAFEPIFLISIAEKVIPQLRYFAGIICLILILNCIIVNELIKNYNKKIFLVLFGSLSIIFIFSQIKNINEIDYLISQNHSFYKFKKENSFNTKTVYIINDLQRKSLENNLLYLELHENNLIKNKHFKKDSYKEIQKKIDKIKKDNSNLVENKILREDLIVFNHGLFEIKNYKKFFDHLKKEYSYIVIDDLEINDLKVYIEKNFQIVDAINVEEKFYFRSLRELLHYYSFGKSINSSNNEFVYGSKYKLYRLTKAK